jgi:hypothetical protein
MRIDRPDFVARHSDMKEEKSHDCRATGSMFLLRPCFRSWSRVGSRCGVWTMGKAPLTVTPGTAGSYSQNIESAVGQSGNQWTDYMVQWLPRHFERAVAAASNVSDPEHDVSRAGDGEETAYPALSTPAEPIVAAAPGLDKSPA